MECPGDEFLLRSWLSLDQHRAEVGTNPLYLQQRGDPALLPMISTSPVGADVDPTGPGEREARLCEAGWEMDMAASYIGKMRLQMSRKQKNAGDP